MTLHLTADSLARRFGPKFTDRPVGLERPVTYHSREIAWDPLAEAYAWEIDGRREKQYRDLAAADGVVILDAPKPEEPADEPETEDVDADEEAAD